MRHRIQSGHEHGSGAIIAGQGQAAAERLAAAHRALRADPDIQFDLRRASPPTPTPAWVRAFGKWLDHVFAPVGRFLRWIGSFMPDAPYARILLWSVLVAVGAALLWMAWTRISEGSWRLPRFRRRRDEQEDAPAEETEWQPAVAPVRAWLEEADAYADEGRYADAAHHLLIRSIEDIGRRRPGLVQPALTSRDLARNPLLPPRARSLFADISEVVERSLFGGRDVSREEWTACRSSYQDFARTPAWKST